MNQNKDSKTMCVIVFLLEGRKVRREGGGRGGGMEHPIFLFDEIFTKREVIYKKYRGGKEKTTVSFQSKFDNKILD